VKDLFDNSQNDSSKNDELIKAIHIPNVTAGFDCKITDKNMKKYQIIYADPPWEYKESGGGHRGTAGLPYQTMSTDDICRLPIQQIADDKSILFIWVTFPRLEQGLRVIKEWGFMYYGLGFDWVKLNTNGITPFWGMGYYTRQNSEICLIGVKKDKNNRIKPQVRNILSVIHSPRREHSRKPDEIRDYIVKICGDIPRVELFARQKTAGWDVWGNEVASDIAITNQ
jgi:N6-adenosine-specific RNA methylase IME4